MGFEAARTALGMVRTELSGLRVSALAGPEAAEMLGVYADLVKVAQAGMTLAAGQVEATNKTSLAGTRFRSAKEALSSAAGISASAAESLLDLSMSLGDHQVLKDAFVEGNLSAAEATEVAKAAARNAAAAQDLVDLAKNTKDFTKLRNAAAGVQDPDPGADARRAERARAARNVKTWTDSDGLAHLKASGPSDAIAALWARINAGADARFRATRASGGRIPSNHHRFDAFMALFEAGAAGGAGAGGAGVARRPRAELFIMVNFESLLRGAVGPGECCEIPGTGPVPVEAARAYLGSATLKFILSDGVDLRAVAHLGRHVGSHLRSALAWKFRACIDCGRGLGLEQDHLEPYAKGGPTSFENLAPRCKACHRDKTRADYPEGTSGYRRRQAAVAESAARSTRSKTQSIGGSAGGAGTRSKASPPETRRWPSRQGAGAADLIGSGWTSAGPGDRRSWRPGLIGRIG